MPLATTAPVRTRTAPKIPPELTSTCTSYQLELSDYCGKILRDLDAKQNALNHQVDLFQNEITVFNTQLLKNQHMRQKYVQLRAELDGKTQQLQQLENELIVKKSALQRLQTQYNELQLSYNNQIEQLNAGRLQNDFCGKQNDHLRSELEARERRVQHIVRLYEEKEEQLERRREELAQQADRQQIATMRLVSREEALRERLQFAAHQEREIGAQVTLLMRELEEERSKQIETQATLQQLRQRISDQEKQFREALRAGTKARDATIRQKEQELDYLIQRLRDDMNKPVRDVGIQHQPAEPSVQTTIVYDSSNVKFVEPSPSGSRQTEPVTVGAQQSPEMPTTRSVKFADGVAQGQLGSQQSDVQPEDLVKDGNSLINYDLVRTNASQMSLGRYVREHSETTE